MFSRTRRRFLQQAAAGGAALLLPRHVEASSVAVPGNRLARFVEHVPLPGAGIIVASGQTQYAFAQTQIERRLHPDLPATPLWAYDGGGGLAGQEGSFGLVVVCERGTPVEIGFTHSLPSSYPAWLPVDTRLAAHGNSVRLLTHLHGGFVAAADDGNPAITPDGFAAGDTQLVQYPNAQPATLLWFHDHGLGTTRLNVVAGLAAAYLIRDEYDTGGADNANALPSGPYEIPLVIQDRQFNDDGTFRYPTSRIPGVTWIGEYFGDVMLVNGKAWPYLEVEPRLYRLRILNGCNARILDLDFRGTRMWQIGADGGLWDAPVAVKSLVLAPAERADVLVDFAALAGQRCVVNSTRPRRPIATPATPLTHVMEIRVAPGASSASTIPTSLLGGEKADLPAPPAANRRFITLNEVEPETAAWRLTLGGSLFEDDVAENPQVGSIEDWYYINLTADTHPMHTHLVMHQVVGRVPFDVEAYVEAAEAAGLEGEEGILGGLDPTPFATGPMLAPDAGERGFKDTTKANPGQFTIIRSRFDLPPGVTAPQRYVHHCHILEHEDNDMMRAYDVVA